METRIAFTAINTIMGFAMGSRTSACRTDASIRSTMPGMIRNVLMETSVTLFADILPVRVAKRTKLLGSVFTFTDIDITPTPVGTSGGARRTFVA
jgi:hypothetical protein